MEMDLEFSHDWPSRAIYLSHNKKIDPHLEAQE